MAAVMTLEMRHKTGILRWNSSQTYRFVHQSFTLKRTLFMKHLLFTAAAIVLAASAPAAAKSAHAAKVASNPTVPQSADIAELNRKSLASIPVTSADTAAPAADASTLAAKPRRAKK